MKANSIEQVRLRAKQKRLNENDRFIITWLVETCCNSLSGSRLHILMALRLALKNGLKHVEPFYVAPFYEEYCKQVLLSLSRLQYMGLLSFEIKNDRIHFELFLEGLGDS